MPLTERKIGLLASALEGLAVVIENGEFSTGGFRGTRN